MPTSVIHKLLARGYAIGFICQISLSLNQMNIAGRISMRKVTPAVRFISLALATASLSIGAQVFNLNSIARPLPVIDKLKDFDAKTFLSILTMIRAPRKIDLAIAETPETSLTDLNKRAFFSIKLN